MIGSRPERLRPSAEATTQLGYTLIIRWHRQMQNTGSLRSLPLFYLCPCRSRALGQRKGPPCIPFVPRWVQTHAEPSHHPLFMLASLGYGIRSLGCSDDLDETMMCALCRGRHRRFGTDGDVPTRLRFQLLSEEAYPVREQPSESSRRCCRLQMRVQRPRS